MSTAQTEAVDRDMRTTYGATPAEDSWVRLGARWVRGYEVMVTRQRFLVEMTSMGRWVVYSVA